MPHLIFILLIKINGIHYPKKFKKQGCTVTIASKEDIEKWTNLPIIPKLQAQWIKEAEEAGAENPAQVMKDIQAIVQEGIEKDK